MSEELKPCPFCGGEAEFSLGKTGDDKDWHYLECSECEAMGPRVQYADHNIDVKGALAAAWNTRTPDTSIATLTEQLEAARSDAKEAEAYAEGLERDLKTCCMAQTVMDNTVAELERERDTLRLVIEANIEKHRSRAEAAEAKLATCEKYRDAYAECDRIGTQAVRDLEAKLAKAVEALRWQADQPEAHPFMAIAARATLAEIEGEKG